LNTANLEGLPENHYSNQMVLISKDRSGKAQAWLQRAADDWEELVVCFKKIELDNLKTKSAYRKAFYDGAAIATLKSRLKMKPINHQVLIMVFLQKILNNS
jgi:hypothetical protein